MKPTHDDNDENISHETIFYEIFCHKEHSQVGWMNMIPEVRYFLIFQVSQSIQKKNIKFCV